MKKILITGVNGFIGNALCRRLAADNKIIGVDIAESIEGALNIVWEQADISDFNSVSAICEKYSPDAVIHCAGIAHQKIGAVDSGTYMRVNSEATENLAKVATKYNPDVQFIFLSSVSVYGEGGRKIKNRRLETKKNGNEGINEEGECWPSSDYAISKLNAEKRLNILYDKNIIRNLVILRLAPVYDRSWSLNLDRRVFTPKKLSYLKFGSGSQRMSALARPNLVDFISYILKSTDYPNENNLCINVCDELPYKFNTIIRVFRESGVFAKRFIISVPLSFVWFITRIAGILFFNKRKWIYSCYDKIAFDLVFDNRKMIRTGFKPKYSLMKIFLS